MLHVQNLTKKFQTVEAVSSISFTVDKGHVLGFLGANGAGKTTTMRMISGFLEPDAGNINICNYNIKNNKSPVQSHIGYLPRCTFIWRYDSL